MLDSNHRMRLIAALVMLSLMWSCASATVIHSIPEGAEVMVNDAVVGVTPYRLEDSKTIGGNQRIKIIKPGYEDFFAKFGRNEVLNKAALITGIFTLIPLLWVMDYKPERTYELQPLQKGPDHASAPAIPN